MVLESPAGWSAGGSALQGVFTASARAGSVDQGRRLDQAGELRLGDRRRPGLPGRHPGLVQQLHRGRPRPTRSTSTSAWKRSTRPRTAAPPGRPSGRTGTSGSTASTRPSPTAAVRRPPTPTSTRSPIAGGTVFDRQRRRRLHPSARPGPQHRGRGRARHRLAQPQRRPAHPAVLLGRHRPRPQPARLPGRRRPAGQRRLAAAGRRPQAGQPVRRRRRRHHRQPAQRLPDPQRVHLPGRCG